MSNSDSKNSVKEFRVNVLPDSIPLPVPEELPEVTHQGDSMTVRQILDKFAMTGQVDLRQRGSYTSNITEDMRVDSDEVQSALDIPDLDGMDELEMSDYLNNSVSMQPVLSSGGSPGDPPPSDPSSIDNLQADSQQVD